MHCEEETHHPRSKTHLNRRRILGQVGWVVTGLYMAVFLEFCASSPSVPHTGTATTTSSATAVTTTPSATASTTTPSATASTTTPSATVSTTASANSPVGFGAGTTGGNGGATVTVTTLSDLKSAVSGSTARIVKISGTISDNTSVKVGSNKTILGIGSNAMLKGISLDLNNVNNVIIRNLTMCYVIASKTVEDEVHIINGTKYVWIDHNQFYDDLDHGKDYYDGQIDITRQSDYITVSWNRLHDHYKTSLVGHDDSYTADTGHLHVTYEHNWFYNVGSRAPSLRFGTGHIYNNYFQNIPISAIHSRMGAQMLIQNNVFRDVKVAITTTGDSKQDGYANISGNDFGGATVTITQAGTFTHAPYNYTLDQTSDVISEVMANSGVGIVG